MTTLLVANRGEIALRVFRTARRMGMRTVAVYSDADAGSPHVRGADVAVHIGPAPAAESYLRRDRIVEAALEAEADMVHPGYGFLAEDDRFARDCADAGLRFVGPPSAVLADVGDKVAAKRLAVEAGVPVLPSYAGEDQRDHALVEAAREIGFPLIVKPAGGGGGKGMSVVRGPEELADAVASARRIAASAFNDDRLILERYLEGPRHVEVQVLADTHGQVLHLGERDCSLQRRHQKILEESPAPGLDADVRADLHSAAVAFARHAGYVGAGTCEFLIGQKGDVGFIEMNARLQVEHPVTELVTGLDLVELQLRVALGEALPLTQEDVQVDGHAIEVRVYAEAPEEGFIPQAGRIEHVRWPDDVRVDTWVEEGTDVSTHYDPLLAKIVVHRPDRGAALAALGGALSRSEVLGVRTNMTFLSAIVRDPVVAGGTVTTDWLDTARTISSPAPDGGSARAAIVAAAAEADHVATAGRQEDPWSALGPWRTGGSRRTNVVLRQEGEERMLVVEGTGPFVIDGTHVVRGSSCHGWTTPDGPASAARGSQRWYVWVDGRQHEVLVGSAERRLAAGPARLDSPLPGRVLAVGARVGEHVEEGRELVVVEAMKMEHSIKAPAAGTVRAVLCAAGDQVERGQALVDFEPD
jgi:3-methylcrotonyl-CoA carboxylase alpha subunit